MKIKVQAFIKKKMLKNIIFFFQYQSVYGLSLYDNLD